MQASRRRPGVRVGGATRQLWFIWKASRQDVDFEMWQKIVDNMKREDLQYDVTDVTGAGTRKEEL